jgi:hypothetical protein
MERADGYMARVCKEIVQILLSEAVFTSVISLLN